MIQLKLLLLLFQFQIVFIKGDAESHYCGLIEKKACCLGWSGKKCNEPVCEKGCGPGKCIEPNICDCRETNRFGQQCERFGAEVASVSQNIELTDQAQCTYLNGRSYKTFDRVKTVQTNFTGNMVLVQDCMSRPPTYQIIVIPQESCVNKSSDDCEITIKFLFKDSIEATYLSSQGVKVGNISYSFPYSKAEFQISDRGHYVYVKGIKDLNIFYNKKGSIFVFAPVTMKKQVCGLCGLYDGNGDDKFETVDASMNPIETDLDFLKIWLSVSRENRMKPDPAIQMVNCDLNEMATCAKVVSIFGSKFEEICYAEFCQMKNQKNSCELMRDIAFLSSPDNIVSDWRYKLDCEEPNCPNKMIWSDCGNNCNNRCGFNNDDVDCSKVCTPGCYCRKDFFWYKNQCKRADECPCEYRASAKQIDSYKFGDKMKKGCQNCLCESRGLWKCDTHDQCSSRCIITGDPHFVTFDNQHIFVEGQCQYIAVMPKEIESDMPQLSIIVENKFCFNSEDITCAKGIKILFGEGLNQTEIEIKSKTEVIINSKLVTIPSKINKGVEISVFKVTSDGLKIEAGDLFSVFRKDDSRIELVLSAKYARKVTGLCGNFNGDPEDDNIMPDGAPAKDDSELAARYRLTQTCHGEVLRQSYLGLCETSIEWGKIANEVCGKFGQGQFKDCEALVPSDKFVTQCKHDVCNCGLLRNASTINCECSAYSAYARICSIKGIQFQWRTPEFCSVICPKNMVYKECGSSCSATCRLRQRPNCDNDCIDGCQCPDDMVIEEKTGNCVKVEDCKCEYMGRDYNANEERKDRCNTCTCINGLWNCTTKDCSSQSYCPNGKVWKDCGGCQRTCRDMNLICDPNSCEPGCYCESGEVYDNNKCIPKGECPCFWQNQSFNESAVITRGPFECQLSCTCRSGKWECPKRDCEGLCKAWGESHYMSFDGKFFDFHGDCSYVLLEDYCNKKSGTFKIVVENVECGSKGTSCTKSIRFYYKDHIIHLIRGAAPIIGRNPTWSPYLGTGIFSKHDYVSSIVIITKELKIQWDRQLSVDVFLTPEYKNNVCGLCGNFDDNVDNDLRNRAGIIDADVNAFADSWKLKTSCPYPEVSKNPCDINKFRESWAIKRCSILKSETFEPCHNTVRYQLYYDKCVQDSCACDRGDDCLCVCTAISQYVHECNRYNIKIQWRNYENCPIMCPPDREYKPCEKVCPEACIGTKSCISDCMEGCYCKNNTYLKDDECVSEKPQCTCKDESGKEYPLGTTVIKNCHKCTCQINGFECEKELIHNCLTTVSTSTVVTTTIPTITSTLNETTTFSTSRSTTTKLCEKPLIISKWDYVKSISATSFSGVNGGVGEFMTEIGWEPHIIDLQPLLTIEFNNKVYIKGISLFLVNVNRYNVFVVHTGNQWNELIVNYTNTDGDARIPNIDMEITKIRFEFERAIQNKNILAKATIEGCGEKKPTTAAITPTTTKTETNTTSTISTTPTTSKTPQITTTASVCKETLTLISTKEFISEIIPSSNFENKEKILTDSWTSNVKDIAPNIMINFYKAITITEIIIENHSNIGRYTIMITEGNSYQTKILKANEENKNQYEQIKIDNINIKVINLSIMLIKKNKSEEVKLKLLIMGCTERKSTKEITTTISTQTPTVTGTGSSSQSISSTTTGTTTSRITGCKEKPVLISTEEYVKEIVVPKNGTSETSLITEIWNTTVIRTEPKFEIKFYKPVIITKIRFENIVNIETFK